MGERWLFRGDQDWNSIAEHLKQTPCPHCKAVGTLIRHGFLRGFDDCCQRITLRARRVFCSNRNLRPGCGRTVSVWLADKIRRLCLGTGILWQFLQGAAAAGITAAIHAVRDFSDCSDRTWQRVWKRFHLAQSKIRTALSSRCPPPPLPAEHRPAAHVLAHLHAAFPHDPCPIAAFQHTLGIFFV